MGFAWLRLFATYGPGDNPDWLIPSVIRQLCSGERPRTSLGTQKWDYLFIDDAAEGVLAAIQPEATGIFNLASGHPVAVRQIIEQLRDMIDPSLDLVFGEVPFGPNQIMHLEGSIEKLQLATGWSPRVELQAGLSKTVDAFRG
jgi:nucleoside-diphosphate-sugar epimerase